MIFSVRMRRKYLIYTAYVETIESSRTIGNKMATLFLSQWIKHKQQLIETFLPIGTVNCKIRLIFKVCIANVSYSYSSQRIIPNYYMVNSSTSITKKWIKSQLINCQSISFILIFKRIFFLFVYCTYMWNVLPSRGVKNDHRQVILNDVAILHFFSFVFAFFTYRTWHQWDEIHEWRVYSKVTNFLFLRFHFDIFLLLISPMPYCRYIFTSLISQMLKSIDNNLMIASEKMLISATWVARHPVFFVCFGFTVLFHY